MYAGICIIVYVKCTCQPTNVWNQGASETIEMTWGHLLLAVIVLSGPPVEYTLSQSMHACTSWQAIQSSICLGPNI